MTYDTSTGFYEITFQPLKDKVANLYKKMVFQMNEDSKETFIKIAIESEKSDSNKVTIYYKEIKHLFHLGIIAGQNWNKPY